MTEIRSYKQANEYLGKKNSRPLRYKTRLNRRGENIAITHHVTDIITYEPDGVVIIDTQGYYTKTTKDRLNAHIPGSYGIWQKDFIWYIWDGGMGKQYVFADGMNILPDGTIEGAGPPAKELKRLNKEILKYSRNYIKALFAGEVGKPGPGDCWYCLLKTQTGETMGEMLRGRENTEDNHIVGHFEEKYYVPSLLVRAIEVFPISPAAKWALADLWGQVNESNKDAIRILHFAQVAEHQLRSSLRRYLRRQLGLAS